MSRRYAVLILNQSYIRKHSSGKHSIRSLDSIVLRYHRYDSIKLLLQGHLLRAGPGGLPAYIHMYTYYSSTSVNRVICIYDMRVIKSCMSV